MLFSNMQVSVHLWILSI